MRKPSFVSTARLLQCSAYGQDQPLSKSSEKIRRRPRNHGARARQRYSFLILVLAFENLTTAGFLLLAKGEGELLVLVSRTSGGGYLF